MRKMIVVLLVALIASVAFGVGTIGSPSASLDKGEVSIGYNYVQSEQDVKVTGLGWLSGTLEDVKTDLNVGTLSYGVTDAVDIFGRFGYADVDAGIVEDNGEQLLGLGIKATLFDFSKDEEEAELKSDLTIGVSAQVNWLRLDDSIPVCREHTIDVDIDVTEVIIAVGPTLDFGNWSIYGGPAIYFLDGDVDLGQMEGQLEETTDLIGFVGASVDVTSDVSIVAEYQIGSDFEVVSIGALFKF